MRAILLLIAMATPAYAGVEVFDCERGEANAHSMFDPVTCEVRNDMPRALASFSYWWQVVQDGREVPWNKGGHEGSGENLGVPVQGGIEPGETVPVTFYFRTLNERADPALVRYEVEVITAYDVNGDPIE